MTVCPGCNALLAQGTRTCCFCAASVPPQAGPVRWSAATSTSETWRIWASFFSAGLYAPFASNYLVRRTAWEVGVSDDAGPLASPGQRLVPSGVMLVGAPTLAVLYFALLSDSAFQGTLGYAQLAMAWLSLASALLAEHVRRRADVVLALAVGPSAVALLPRRADRFALFAASIPLALAVLGSGVARRDPGAVGAYGNATALALSVACLATSWMHIEVVHRLRAALTSPP